MRERIGNPPVRPLAEIPAGDAEAALDALLDLLFEHNLVVDYLGAWDERSAYQSVAEELLDYEIDETRIEDTYCHFGAATAEYEAESWVEDFMQAVFWHARDYLLPMLEPQQLYDADGETTALADFMQKLEESRGRLPGEANTDFLPTSTELRENEASVTAAIT